MSKRRPEVVLSVGCFKVAQALPPVSIFTGNRSVVSPALSSGDGATSGRGPFHGLTICVTGLSKDSRRQVQEATEKMGGQYSPNLHPQCTHLVVQSFAGRKFEHALKHGLQRGLFVVTLAWLVNCVKKNAHLDESLYSVKHLVNSGVPLEEFSNLVTLTNEEHSCLPSFTQEDSRSLSLTMQLGPQPSNKDLVRQSAAILLGMCFYVDPDLSTELRAKIVEAAAKEAATFVDHWYIGCEATHVVCEGNAMMKYLGFNTNLVTPLWLMKTLRERHHQRSIHMSADLARHISILLNTTQNGCMIEDGSKAHGSWPLAICGPGDKKVVQAQIQERQQQINAAKEGIRRRRGSRMQPCRPRAFTPSSLLQSVFWSITEPSSAACFITDSSGSTLLEKGLEVDLPEKISMLCDVHKDGREQQLLSGIPEIEIHVRPMSESEKKEVVFKGSFLTILFPVDRFAEMGPSSRTYFSEKGFERQQILDHIYSFYQEFLSPVEVNVAIHTDSQHANKLRSVYAVRENVALDYVPIKRGEFLGSRKIFEGLKRIGRENTGQIYELWLGA